MAAAAAVAAIAREATVQRYGFNGADDESDAFRHFSGSYLLSWSVGSDRAFAILNANEVQNGAGRPASVRMDTHNNWVAVTMSRDPRFRNMSVEEAADYALNNGCLITRP